MGLGVGRLRTSIWPWIRELEIIALLELGDEEDGELGLWAEAELVFFS